NIGRPLRDCSAVASSWMTSQCSAFSPFSVRTDVGDDPCRRTEANEPAVQNDEVAARRRKVVLVAQRLRHDLDHAEQPFTPWRNVRAMLDVTRRPVLPGGGIIALVEEAIERV